MHDVLRASYSSWRADARRRTASWHPPFLARSEEIPGRLVPGGITGPR